MSASTSIDKYRPDEIMKQLRICSKGRRERTLLDVLCCPLCIYIHHGAFLSMSCFSASFSCWSAMFIFLISGRLNPLSPSHPSSMMSYRISDSQLFPSSLLHRFHLLPHLRSDRLCPHANLLHLLIVPPIFWPSRLTISNAPP